MTDAVTGSLRFYTGFAALSVSYPVRHGSLADSVLLLAEAVAEINRGAFAERLTAGRAAKRVRLELEPREGENTARARAATPEEIATAIKRSQSSGDIYMKLLAVANRKTALADVRYDDSGNKIDPSAEEKDELDGDSSVYIVSQE